jgi:hypothetical protein
MWPSATFSYHQKCMTTTTITICIIFLTPYVTRTARNASDAESRSSSLLMFCSPLKEYEYTPLMKASRAGKMSVVKILLKHKADIQHRAEDQVHKVLTQPPQLASNHDHPYVLPCLSRSGPIHSTATRPC